jgi:hypothetical protein
MALLNIRKSWALPLITKLFDRGSWHLKKTSNYLTL